MTLTRIANPTWAETFGEMRRMTHEGMTSAEVRQVAEQLYQQGPDPIAQIYNFVRDNYPYVPDPVVGELFRHPRRLAAEYNESGTTYGLDCDDFAMYLAALLSSVGYETRIVIADYHGSGWEHAFAEVFSEKTGRWIPVDPATDAPLGWVSVPVRRTTIEV